MSSAKLTCSAAQTSFGGITTPTPMASAPARAAAIPSTILAIAISNVFSRMKGPLGGRTCGARRIAALLGELELQRADMKRVSHLGVVEHRNAEFVRAVELVELDVEPAASHELARHDRGPLAVLPGDRRRDLAAVAGEWRHQDRSHLVAGHELAVVERSLVLFFQVIRAALVGRDAALVHELGLAVDQLDVGVAPGSLGIA